MGYVKIKRISSTRYYSMSTYSSRERGLAEGISLFVFLFSKFIIINHNLFLLDKLSTNCQHYRLIR